MTNTPAIPDREAIHARTGLVIGQPGLDALARARVLVVGLGGVGGGAVEALARGGIGLLRVCDGDVFQPGNLNRQLLARVQTLGMNKAEAARAHVAEIAPHCRVEVCPYPYHSGVAAMPARAHVAEVAPNCRAEACGYPCGPGVVGASARGTERPETPAPDTEKLTDDMDFVLDCIDDVSAKVVLAVRCHERGISLISAMGTGNKLFPERLKIGDLSKTSHCPLARRMRQQLRAHGILHLPVVFSDEQPVETNQPTVGSVSFVPPVAGMMMAGYAIREIIAGDRRAEQL